MGETRDSHGSDTTDNRRLVAFLSGSGRTLMNLLDRIDAGDLAGEIVGVVGSRECPGLDKARDRGLPTRVVRGRLEGGLVEAVLREHDASWGVLCGYLQLLEVPESYQWKIVNIHPALLPSFGGRGMYGERVHRAVLEAGCRVSGCTVHLCDNAYDRGPIILQRACPVMEDDTPESLARRVFMLECAAYPEAISLLLGGRVRVESRRACVDRS